MCKLAGPGRFIVSFSLRLGIARNALRTLKPKQRSDAELDENGVSGRLR